MAKLKLGAQLYSIRDYMKNEEDFKVSMERIAKMGYKYVQVSGIGNVSPKCIKEATENNGLEVVITHNTMDRVLNDTEKLIEEHKLFNCNIIGIGGLFGEDMKTAEGYMRFTDYIAPAVEKIKSAGMTFGYHNHAHEFEKKDGKHFFDIIWENTDKEAFKFTVDAFWLHYAGLDEAKWLEEHADRICVTHFKDMGMHEGKQVIFEIMEGNMNYDRILKVCEKCNLTMNFVELDEARFDVFDCMKISYDNLMSTGMFIK